MIQKIAGFDITTADVVDKRFHKTKAEMKATIDAVTPSPYPCWCPEDGKMYIYNVSNAVDATTGKYKVFEGSSVSPSGSSSTVVVDSGGTISVKVSEQANNAVSATTEGIYVQDKAGDLATLTTSAKTDTVAAINELNEKTYTVTFL